MDLIPWRNKRRPESPEPTERPLARFRDEIEDLFGRFMSDPWGTGLTGMFPRPRGLSPQLDVAESDDEITIRAELPGVDPKDVHIEVTGNTLTLSGEKSEETREQERTYRYCERQFGSFSRSLQLPVAVDADKVDAAYKDGVLTITLAKHPAARPKRITVRNA